jgi:hypothetical protein
MPKVDANGIDLFYEVHGTGDPVLLIAQRRAVLGHPAMDLPPAQSSLHLPIATLTWIPALPALPLLPMRGVRQPDRRRHRDLLS